MATTPDGELIDFQTAAASIQLVVLQRQGDPVRIPRIRTMHCTAAVAEVRHRFALGHARSFRALRPRVAIGMQANPSRDSRRTPTLPKDSGAPAFLEFHKLRKKKPLVRELLQNGLHTRPNGIVQPVILRKAWPKIRYGRRRGITFEEHQKILAVTPREDYRLFFELLWETGGAQTDIASLTAEDIDWEKRRLFYERQKLASRELGRTPVKAELVLHLRVSSCAGILANPGRRTVTSSRRDDAS